MKHPVWLRGGPYDGQVHDAPGEGVAVRIKTLHELGDGQWTARDDVWLPTSETVGEGEVRLTVYDWMGA